MALYGEAGTDVQTVELTWDSQTVARRVNLPTGVWVASAATSNPITVRFLGSDGEVLAQDHDPGDTDDVEDLESLDDEGGWP